MKMMAPMIPPYSRPAPPSTSMISTSAERWKLRTSSETVSVVCARIAPAMPAMTAAIV
jgi:hypothetical protein